MCFLWCCPRLCLWLLLPGPLNDIFNPEFTLRYELVTLTLFGLAFIVGRYLLKLSRKEASLFSLNASYPNYGYIGNILWLYWPLVTMRLYRWLLFWW